MCSIACTRCGMIECQAGLANSNNLSAVRRLIIVSSSQCLHTSWPTQEHNTHTATSSTVQIVDCDCWRLSAISFHSIDTTTTIHQCIECCAVLSSYSWCNRKIAHHNDRGQAAHAGWQTKENTYKSRARLFDHELNLGIIST